MGRDNIKFLGRAAYDVQDVLANSKNVKARQLRMGGVVYAHVEIQRDNLPTRSLCPTTETPILRLRLQATSLVHTSSTINKLAPIVTSKCPDTFIEIGRLSASHEHIVTYRSSVVKECLSPTLDTAMIEFPRDGNQSSIVVKVVETGRKGGMRPAPLTQLRGPAS